MPAKVVTLTDASWESKVLSSKLPVVVDFWADWCAPCRVMAPTIEALADELEGKAVVGKLDVDSNPEVAERYQIRGMPTVMVFENGEVKERVVGIASKEYLDQLIGKHLQRGNGNE